MLADVIKDDFFDQANPGALSGVTTLSWWGSLHVSVTPRTMSVGVRVTHAEQVKGSERVET